MPSVIEGPEAGGVVDLVSGPRETRLPLLSGDWTERDGHGAYGFCGEWGAMIKLQNFFL